MRNSLLVVDVWSRKVVAWDVAEREDAKIAADLVSRACLRERISRHRGFGPQQRPPLILHADNGNAMRAATLEVRLEELGVLLATLDKLSCKPGEVQGAPMDLHQHRGRKREQPLSHRFQIISEV